MLQDTDKLLLFDSSSHLKVFLPLPVPTHCASGLSPPEEQRRVAMLWDQPALRLTESMLRQDYTWESLVPALPLLRLSLPGELFPPQAPSQLSLARPAVVTTTVPVCRGVLVPPQCHRGQDLVSSSSLLARVCNCALKGQKLLQVLSNNESFLREV